MKDDIQNKIEDVFQYREEIPLYYVESGSRLWKIESHDSDFDVRGFHLQPKKRYFDYVKYKDNFELMEGDFDFVSYDIDKMFNLLANGNPTVFEWIRSDILYFNALPEWKDFKKGIVENFNFKSLFHHYLSLAKHHISMMRSKVPTYKILFYCIRGLISAKLASERIIPELDISQLFTQYEKYDDNDNLLEFARESLAIKKQEKEKKEISKKNREDYIASCEGEYNELRRIDIKNINGRDKLISHLTSYSIDIKNKIYLNK